MDLYRVFGAGDTGTRELLHLMANNNIPHIFMDIRRHAKAKVKAIVDPIEFLSSQRLQTVPQVFLNDRYIGTYETTIQHLERQMTLECPQNPDAA